MTIKSKYFLLPLLLAVLIFISNFLNTKIFGAEIVNFTVWFILSLFIFAIGWLINNLFGWVKGGKIIFAVIIAMVFISALFITLFSDYFLVENLLFENLILFSLRNVFLGSMAFFGMTLCELLVVQSKLSELENQDSDYVLKEAMNKAELALKKSTLEAEKIIFDANKKAAEILDQKNNLENKIKEFIEIEKELIKKYESDKH